MTQRGDNPNSDNQLSLRLSNKSLVPNSQSLLKWCNSIISQQFLLGETSFQTLVKSSGPGDRTKRYNSKNKSELSAVYTEKVMEGTGREKSIQYFSALD